jgi:single-strand DNA-binding protein
MTDETPVWRDINRVELRGRLGRDPELRTFSNGGQVCNFSLATSEKWKDKNNGEMKERTVWHRCVVRFDDAKINEASKFVKGQRIRAVGKIATREFTDAAGNKREAFEIEIGRFGELGIVPDERDDTPARQPAPASAAPARRDFDDDSEIPF